MNKDAQQAGKAAAIVSIRNASRGKGGHCTLFEGHCTSKNGASPELKLIKAPVLETSVWATAGKTSDSPFFTAQYYWVTNHEPTTDCHAVKPEGESKPQEQASWLSALYSKQSTTPSSGNPDDIMKSCWIKLCVSYWSSRMASSTWQEGSSFKSRSSLHVLSIFAWCASFLPQLVWTGDSKTFMTVGVSAL